MQAYKNGYNGRTSQISPGCNCHYDSPNSETLLKVESESGSFTVLPGSKTKFTVTVEHASLAKAGVGIAVKNDINGETNIGTLEIISGEGLQIKGNELVHTAPKSLTGGKVTFSFNWVAPTTPGKYYLRAVGNAVNGNNNPDPNDKWNWMVPKEINVENGSSIFESKYSRLVSPNPFRDYLRIDLSMFADAEVRNVTIYDINGNMMHKFGKLSPILIWDRYSVDGKKTAAGVYYVEIEFRDYKKIIPVISL